jgi:hypothetical protein
MTKLNVREKFLELTSKTYPHGTEEGLLPMLPNNLQIDGYGNYYLEIGDPSEYTCMFTSHLDTACKKQEKVKHVFKGNKVGTDGKTILGGDCKAGVAIMLKMIESGVPGLYYFFLGEEVGCKGSKWLSQNMYNGDVLKGHKITKIISFDRRGTTSIITHQWDGRCASDAFADSLIKEFKGVGMKMEKDTTGVCTDSIQFQEFIPECTNISVGYYSEHTGNESQDLKFLEEIAEAVTKISWDSLAVERDPSVKDYGNYYEEEWEEEYDEYLSSLNSVKTWDTNYSTWMRDPYSKEKIEVYVSVERINVEKRLILDILKEWGVTNITTIVDVDWNGRKLVFDFEGDGEITELTRNTLAQSDARLGKITYEDIKLMDEV